MGCFSSLRCSSKLMEHQEKIVGTSRPTASWSEAQKPGLATEFGVRRGWGSAVLKDSTLILWNLMPCIGS